uniref:Uncharacterized protein n=1 Tax=viral metagenome TaxID=1070528 RepID=A0A6M3K7L6_9ZZZZ
MADREILQNPKNINGNNLVWIVLQPYKITYQSAAGRRGTAFEAIPIGHQFKLLAPSNITYTLGHTWDEYESMATRMLGKLVDVAKLKSEIGAFDSSLGILEDLGSGVVSLATGNLKDTVSKAETSLKKLQGAMSGVSVVNAKVDAPLVYKNSDRRGITFSFKLMASTSKTSAKSEVFDIAHLFEIYSCPDYTNNDVTFSPPYVFDVHSSPGNMVNIRRAALTSVQPTWEYPYDDNGYPMSCSLDLTFKDMSPLFRVTIEKGSFPIRVSEKPKKSTG